MFKDLGLPGKEFILPNITSPWLTEEFVVHPDVSDQIELESYPTSILDDSCLLEALRTPSIPLVESVEAFALGLIDNPFGHSSVKPNVDYPLTEQESHGLKPSTVDNAASDVVSSDLAHNQAGQIGNIAASTADAQASQDNPQVSLMDERSPVAGDQEVSSEDPHFVLTREQSLVAGDQEASSDNPNLVLMNEQSPMEVDQQMRVLIAK